MSPGLLRVARRRALRGEVVTRRVEVERRFGAAAFRRVGLARLAAGAWRLRFTAAFRRLPPNPAAICFAVSLRREGLEVLDLFRRGRAGFASTVRRVNSAILVYPSFPLEWFNYLNYGQRLRD